MLKISIAADVKRLTATLDDIARKQIPFATSLAINAVAFEVQRGEQMLIRQTFKNPRPFTVKSIVVRKATKASPTATVSIRPEVAKYLQPYETGGVHVLPGRAALVPVNIRLDQYGQLPRTALKRLDANPNVFVGEIHGIRGFWQRTRRHGLKLLVRFGNALPVNQHLGFYERATAIVKADMPAALKWAMEKALASARK